MAVMALMMGSLLGMVAGLVGWLVIGLPALTALALYFVVSLGLASAGIVRLAAMEEPAHA